MIPTLITIDQYGVLRVEADTALLIVRPTNYTVRMKIINGRMSIDIHILQHEQYGSLDIRIDSNNTSIDYML